MDRRVLGVGQVVDAREQDEEERARRRRREGRVGALGRGHREEDERDEGEGRVVAGRLCLVRRADRPVLDARRGVAEEQALHRREPGQREDRQRREGAKVVRMPQEHGHEADRDSRALDGLDDPLLVPAAFLIHDIRVIFCSHLQILKCTALVCFVCFKLVRIILFDDDNDDQSTCAGRATGCEGTVRRPLTVLMSRAVARRPFVKSARNPG